MVYNGGWTNPQLKRLNTLLTEPHKVSVRVLLMNLEHNLLRDLTSVFMDGSVTMDTSGDFSRSCEVNLVDPFQQLGLDPGDPSTAIFPTRMLQVWYDVAELDDSFTWRIPLFTGPINKVSRNGIFLDVECMGKEMLASSNIWAGMTLPKGLNKRECIVKIMTQLGGESVNYMNISSTPGVLRDDLSVKRSSDNTPWRQAKRLASSVNFQLYYNGLGILMGMPWGGSEVFQFNENYLITPIQVDYNLEDLINAVQVTGGTPKGAKDPVVARVVAIATHPLSPWALQRNGVPRFLPEFVEDDDLTTQDDVNDRAWTVLINHIFGGVTLAADSMVVPYLEEGDLVSYYTTHLYAINRLNKFTIPLTGAPTMALGYDARFTRGVLKRKRKKSKKGGKGKDRLVP